MWKIENRQATGERPWILAVILDSWPWPDQLGRKVTTASSSRVSQEMRPYVASSRCPERPVTRVGCSGLRAQQSWRTWHQRCGGSLTDRWDFVYEHLIA